MTKDYGQIRVRPARPEDAAALAPRLRPADLREIEARSGRSPQEVLAYGLTHGDAYAVEKDGVIAALFGVAPTPEPKLGCVWLLGSDDIQTFRLTFLRHSREWLSVLFKDYDLLGNFVDARNEVHIQWLQWLGFRFLRRLPMGRHGETFIEFVRLKSPQDFSSNV